MEVDHPTAETAFVQQLDIDTDIGRQSPLAASHHGGDYEEVVLIDNARPDRLGSEFGTTYPIEVLSSYERDIEEFGMTP